MSEPSDVTHVTNENDAPENSELTELVHGVGKLLESTEKNTFRLAEATERLADSTERIANAMEAYCKLHGAKLGG